MDVLIVGASARAAAHSAIRAGLRPAAIDLFADRDLAAVAPCLAVDPGGYPDNLVEAARRMPHAPWMFTGGIENHPDLVDQLRGSRPLWGCGPASLRTSRDPSRWAEVLHDAGLPAPMVRLDPTGLPRDGSWLQKPLHSSGGVGIAPWNAPMAPEASLVAQYYQEYVDGSAASAVFIGDGRGATLLGVTRQFLGKPEAAFAYAGGVTPPDWPDLPGLRRRIASAGEAVASAFELVGLFGLDMIVAGDAPWVVEVNHRYTASVELIELSLELSWLNAHRAACVRRVRPDPPGPARRFVAKRVVWAERDAVCPYGDAGSEGPRPAFEVPEAADLPEPGTRFRRGDPVVTVFSEGSTLDVCLETLKDRTERWRGRIESWPKS